MKLVKNKLNTRRGFSLAETLVAVIIILLVSSVIAAGMPAAQRAYNNVLATADAQVYMSTALTELRKELATATNISVSEDRDEVDYINPVTGECAITFDGTDLMISRYGDTDVSSKLVPRARDSSLSITFKEYPFPDDGDDTIFTIGEFKVSSSKIKDNEGNESVLASVGDYKIEILVPEVGS